MSERRESISAHLEWDHDATEEVDALYANQLFISQTETEVTLVFGTALSPPFTEPPEEDLQIEIKPVAKVVVSRQAMKKFLKVMENTFEDDEQKDKE